MTLYLHYQIVIQKLNGKCQLILPQLMQSLEFTDRLKELDKKLEDAEKNKCFNDLDFPIKDSEIYSAIGRLKRDKAPGLDHISNNMLKSGQIFLTKCLIKLFNTSLLYGLYPKSWAEGYIKTLHKGGDKDEPKWRGRITITRKKNAAERESEDSDEDSDDDVQVTIGGAIRAITSTGTTKGVDVEAVGSINGVPTYDFDLDGIQAEDKPWRKPGHVQYWNVLKSPRIENTHLVGAYIQDDKFIYGQFDRIFLGQIVPRFSSVFPSLE
ncbi:FIP1 [Mytilus edulis]|uniref:FIP1L1 n=1 Tax=Mytilus edulis TaxID=6550 RepID=A0A8S3V3Y0_MYTED|nr:FIP1 [Mytilus edulis]